MELIYSITVGVMVACSVFLMLRGNTFSVVLGLTLMSYAVNLFLFASGGLALHKPAILAEGATYADPLPQALVLTAIVIGFAMTAFALILAIRGRADLGNDNIDGRVESRDALVSRDSKIEQSGIVRQSPESSAGGKSK